MATTWNLSQSHSSRPRRTLEELLDDCGVHINGSNPWDIRVFNEDFYARVLHQGSLGFGESYMERWWDVGDLEELIYRVLKARLDERVQTWRDVIAYLSAAFVNRQRRSRAFVVGERHYDIGNDLYERMLDSRMIYSCGYWENANTLEEAQRAKLDLVFRKLALQPGQRVLDVGCGWGGALEYAAREYGVEGVGVTISREQADYARKRCAGLPIEIRLEDYRETRGDFDHIYSIGMFEHVGPKNYRTYMQTMRRCLRPGGRFLLHTIGANRTSVRPGNDPWIEKYIFPNSKLPTESEISAATGGLFNVVGQQSIGLHYVRTLRAWRANFERSWPTLKRTRDDEFFRMWEFYLNSSAATFRSENADVWQWLLTPEGRP
ncbi:MAG TPA: cyclopropane fatty acyl phospholipid synthase [Steroidobacteraceae bacterium]|jgi:cyclopropane-fatty-acyl-phospholipid synthase|nr:cyclopropane fatty acyl phospholipid synthase [Steroidobacteraceae bacterium]